MINRNKIALTVFVFLSLFNLLFPETGMIYKFGKISDSGNLIGGLKDQSENLANAVTIIAEISTIVFILFFCLQFSVFIQAIIRLVFKLKMKKGIIREGNFKKIKE